mgnify:CR=1 FL=1
MKVWIDQDLCTGDGLCEEIAPDVFTLRVSGIRPDEDVTVETSYVQLARPDGAGWSLRAPLATAPRYVRSDERTSRHAQGQPLPAPAIIGSSGMLPPEKILNRKSPPAMARRI